MEVETVCETVSCVSKLFQWLLWEIVAINIPSKPRMQGRKPRYLLRKNSVGLDSPVGMEAQQFSKKVRSRHQIYKLP
jgi:hypothetical protein